MTPLKQAIIDIFALFATANLGNPPSETMTKTVALWEVVMGDCTPEELHAAALAWMRTPQSGCFWPQPAGLRALIPRLAVATLALEAADPDTGRDRWPGIVRHAGSIGRSHPQWAEELAHRIGVRDVERLRSAIEDAGGWQKLCNADSDYARDRMGKRFAHAWDRQARGTEIKNRIESQEGNVLFLADVAARRLK